MTPVWMMKEFWVPFIIGLTGTFAFTVSYYFGIDVPAEQIVGVVIGLIGGWLGFNNANDKRKHG